MTVAPQYPIRLWALWQLHHNTLYFCEFCDGCTTIPYYSVSSVSCTTIPYTWYFCEFCNTSGTPQRFPWEICIQYPTLLWVLWLLYHNTLHFCEFCNTSVTLQRLPSGSVTDPVPYSDYPYPTKPILGYFDHKTKTTPVGGRRREHGRGRPRQSRERRARWGTSSKQRTEWRISSRARAFTAQIPVRIWLLDCWDMANIYLYWSTYVYINCDGISTKFLMFLHFRGGTGT